MICQNLVNYLKEYLFELTFKLYRVNLPWLICCFAFSHAIQNIYLEKEVFLSGEFYCDHLIRFYLSLMQIHLFSILQDRTSAIKLL